MACTQSAKSGVRRVLSALLGCLFVAHAAAQEQLSTETGRPGIFEAGAYSFSDELGGFDILSVAGKGSRTDPFVVRQSLRSATPVTMTIRTIKPIRPFDSGERFANGILHMRIETINESGVAWIEFEFELQERLGEPSTFGDGLSFDQRSGASDTLSSDSFDEYSRDFEPYDKVLFRNGKVDPGKEAGFSLLITDYTPRWIFFLVQDPRLPSS